MSRWEDFSLAARGKKNTKNKRKRPSRASVLTFAVFILSLDLFTSAHPGCITRCAHMRCGVSDNREIRGEQEVSVRASAQQQESCVSILSAALPPPLGGLNPPTAPIPDNSMIVRFPPPPPSPLTVLFFFLRILSRRGHRGVWEAGCCISFAERLFGFRETAGLASLP